MLTQVYNSFKADQLIGSVSLSADANAGLIHVILLSGYTPDIDAHTKYGDVSAFEVNLMAGVSGYSAGGQAVSAGVTVTVDTVNDRASFDANDITWTLATISARHAVLVKVRNNGLNKDLDNLIGYIDFGSVQSSSNGNFTIQWNTNGVILFS